MSREAWKAAKAELEAIEAERAALVAHTNDRYLAAEEKLDRIEEDSPERFGQCECGEPIWDGDRYSYDSNNSIYLCESCAPSYADMLADPTNFYGDDDEYLTPEQAKAIVDAHIAAGGSVEDKMVSA